ncbi:MAG: glucosamine-6-phosphate deaminase [Planctomycetota bacterium]|nr:MAG: glucosamine-6-phosphate deaminase [Planctomycetota bacterium]
MRVIIEQNYVKMSKWAAYRIAGRINSKKPTAKKPFVLGLPTGSTPLGTYKELIKLLKDGVVSFKNVITFNMDEYVGLSKTHTQSYHYFMNQNFFKYIDIQKKNINILNGMAKDLTKECENYEKKIKSCGGIDLFLGGIGEDGHIAFNEPGSSFASRTRKKALTQETRMVNSRFFDYDLSQVPRFALTIGVGTFMDAREAIVLVSGDKKSRALKMVVEEGINHMWTASSLQNHPKGIIVCDEDSTQELKVRTAKYFKDIEQSSLDPRTQL